MEIIVRNLHDQSTEKQVNYFFKDVLEKLGIYAYHCQKLGGKVAKITILDQFKAKQFFQKHGQTKPGKEGFATVSQKLYYRGKPINCLWSKETPDAYLLLSLKKDESERYALIKSTKPVIIPGIAQPRPGSNRRAFTISYLECGQLTYHGMDLAFVPYFQGRNAGRIIFGPHSIMIKTSALDSKNPPSQVEIFYRNISTCTLGLKSSPSFTIDLSQAPRLFESLATESEFQNNPLESALRKLSFQKPNQAFTRKRISALDPAHETVVSSCLCYRVMLANPTDIVAIQAMRKFPEIPKSITWNAYTVMKKPFAMQMSQLNATLAGTVYNKMPFILKFQLQKLAQNGYLEPSKVESLLPVVARHIEANQSATTVAESVRNLGAYLPFAGPETEAAELSIGALSGYLVHNQASIIREETSLGGLAHGYDHIALVHKATITPVGTYLYGPDPETKNRVLRRYSNYLDYFLSVTFADEDGESLFLDPRTSGDEIYQGRFKKVLESGINIAGRQYEVRSDLAVR